MNYKSEPNEARATILMNHIKQTKFYTNKLSRIALKAPTLYKDPVKRNDYLQNRAAELTKSAAIAYTLDNYPEDTAYYQIFNKSTRDVVTTRLVNELKAEIAK